MIRQPITNKYGATLAETSLPTETGPWELLFQIADREERLATGKSEIVPYWHVETKEAPWIERIIPLYPFQSRPESAQAHSPNPRPSPFTGSPSASHGRPELVDHLLEPNFSEEELREIKDQVVINLSPIQR